MGFFDSLFPADDYALIAVILGFPLLGAFVNGIWGKRLGKDAVRLMALTAIGASFAACVIAFLALDGAVDSSSGSHAKLAWTAWEWMHTNGGRGGGNVNIDLRFSIDALSGVMMLIVTGVGFLIHLYSTAYMAEDKAYWRFFAYLNLFIFSMLILILGDNLPVLFVGWEGVGLCSYLLIGFWYEGSENASAGKKAFIANRIGDFGLICAMFLIVHYTGALDWTGIASGAHNLADNASDAYRIHLWPLGGGRYQGALEFLQPAHPITISAATAVGLALLLGCTGKSAQIPLYVWLPDAMAGPTPVSALIHAATMVTAGIYLVCRLSFVFVLSPFVMTAIAVVGGLTAIFAATIALVQNDIKKVLAYSTVSQLGYMFLGVGVGAFTAGFFHVLTHAFFKACLFLGAGSVIHAMHARIHDTDASQDMRNMGGLKRFMPTTYWTFLVATLAIAGAPLLSGFFSKDEILYRAFTNRSIHPFKELYASRGLGVWEPPEWIHTALYGIGVLAAVLTAFYMFRCFFLTFHGDFRGWTIGRRSRTSRASIPSIPEEGDHHHDDDLTQPGPPPHESPNAMTIPLIILAAFAALAGGLNPAPFVHELPLEHWLEPVFEAAKHDGVRAMEGAEELEYTLMLGGIAAFAIGSGFAYWAYVKEAGAPVKRLADSVPKLHKLLLDKWRIDELYERTVIAAVDALADTAASFDQWVVDGVIAKLSALLTAVFGTIFRAFQTGVVHVYASVMALGLAALGWFFVLPHADATIDETTAGDYVVKAAPGMGYGYRWDANGDGAPDAEAFTGQQDVKVHLEPGGKTTVRLEVVNAFGFTTYTEIDVERPAAAAPATTIQVGQR